jgi:hypothetical protein
MPITDLEKRLAKLEKLSAQAEEGVDTVATVPMMDFGDLPRLVPEES